ncbi:MAG: sodium:solute symporter family transporter [Deltaproteobacteria bacterium]
MLSGSSLLILGAVVLLLATLMLALVGRSSEFIAHSRGGGASGPLAGGLSMAGLFALFVTALLPGLVYQHGFDALLPSVGIAGGLLILSVLVGPALTHRDAATLPELVGRRFGRVSRAFTLLVSVAASAGLLLGALSVTSSLAARLLHLPIVTTALALAAAISLIVMPGGLKSVLSGSRLVACLMGLTLLGLFGIVCAVLLGNPIPPLAYGKALAEIRPAEMALIEQGAVDFGVFKPFMREFLTIDRLNWALLAVSLMAAVAALPPLVQATGAFATANARRGIAWTLTFVVIALSTVPALSALARLETYRVVAASGSYSDLPDWIRRGSEVGAVELHGTSLALVDAVARDISSGADSIGGISAARADAGMRAETQWQRLDPAVQEAVLDLARRVHTQPPAPLPDRWTVYVDTVVMAAATAAGKISGKPDLASITIEPQYLLLALPHAAGFPAIVSITVIATILAAGLISAAALVSVLSSMLVRDGVAVLACTHLGNSAEVMAIRLTSIALAFAFSLTAALVPLTADALFVVSLALSACGLFPALVLTLWVPRSNAFGFLAALLTGLAFGTYYLAGTAIYSVPFYETWAALSSAGPDAFAEYEEAREIWVSAEGDERAAAFADLAARTTGSLWSPGLANWFGIAPAAAPVLAIPVAILVGVLFGVAGSWSRRAARRAEGSVPDASSRVRL